MEIKKIVIDSLKYPFSNWKKMLILGIILVITDTANISLNFGKNVDLLVILIGIAFVAGLLVNGYIFRTIKSSLDGKIELPEFNNWADMSLKGAKVYIVSIVYLIPVILSIIYLSSLATYFGINAIEFIPAFHSVFWQGIGNFFDLIGLFGMVIYQPAGIIFIETLYLIIITPILLVAIASMAFDNGDLKSAFEIRDIIEEISIIGWGNLIKWYILTGIIFIIFMNVTFIEVSLFNMIKLHLLGEIINSLIICSYLSIFLSHSMALFYKPILED
jgi:hypothetical protein